MTSEFKPTNMETHETTQFISRILAYMALKGYEIARNPGEVNIIYVEGCDPDGRPNEDREDLWNDLRIVITFDGNGTPSMQLCEPATTEPGRAPTYSTAAQKRGGVARIAFGQFNAWKLGFHKWNIDHPALIQCCNIPVHRDRNKDGKRTGDAVHIGLFGINQHGTSQKYRGTFVGYFSEGCAVAKVWARHLFFIGLCKNDPRYKADPEFIFPSTFIAGDDLAKLCPIDAPV